MLNAQPETKADEAFAADREPDAAQQAELLAPAGNMTCLHAAVRAGADAVYLGCEDFNARRGADNFTLDNLAEACDFAHLRGVKVYLTLNIAVLVSEAPRAIELARQAYRRGVDAFIVQDLGVAHELRRVLPDARLHISTQMNTHDADGIRAAAALGAKRVTLARELTLEEIAELSGLAHDLGMETECFGHGALCVCYSGQCFMSSMIGGRSANRGTCAQACRLPYRLSNVAVKKDLPAPGEHLLSPKDLCSAPIMDSVLATRVDSLKIEGRMKSPEYVSTVVGVYRRVIDTGVLSAADQRALSEAFSRGFTTGYLEGERGNDLMSYGRPNNRGVFVGRVADARSGEQGSTRVSIAGEVELHEGDVLEFWTNKGHFAHTLDSLETDRSGNTVCRVERRVSKGDRVFRVRDASLAFADDPYEPRLAVSGSVSMRIGEPLTMEFRLDSDFAAFEAPSVRFEGPVVEAARTKPVTAEDVAEHVDRLGNMPFALSSLDVDVEEGAGIGFSALHKARSQALKNLEERILAPYRSRTIPRTPEAPNHPPARRNRVRVCALATNPACARAARKAGADFVYVPALNYKRGEGVIAGQLSATSEQAGYPNKCVVSMPVVDKRPLNADGEFDPWRYVKADRPVLVEHYGQLIRAVEEGIPVEVGPHIPVVNSLSLGLMADLDVERVWLSPELSLQQIKELADGSPVALGLTVAGYQELMTCEHCLLMSQGPCNQRCSECARRKSPHFLEDRKGYRFQVVTDLCGRSHLYNSVQLDVLHLAPQLVSAGITAFMVDTSLLNVDQTSKLVARAVRARDLAERGDNAVSKAEGCTSGHLFRGVQ